MTEPNISEELQGSVGELPSELGEETATDAGQQTLLSRLLYRGVLPRYAFPTDVTTFYVFDINRSTSYRTAFLFAPSQSLAVGLSQYAPGKEVWIANKRFTSGAIYSPIFNDRIQAWRDRRLYYECTKCHFACTQDLESGHRGELADCPACGTERSFGEAKYWFRPPGFAHPVFLAENVSPDDSPPNSRATRAKLDAPTPDSSAVWVHLGERIRAHYFRKALLVTNTGPKTEGYNYCTFCGRIEPTTQATKTLFLPHPKPFPDDKAPTCEGRATVSGVCIGTDFISDILLLNFAVQPPVRLTPGLLATDIALRTCSEALAKAACDVLELEEGEVQADFRAALTERGQAGSEAEVYLYDTLPGGAGFARRVGDRLLEVFERAIDILSNCDCDSSCYKCLRSFKNKYEHDKLDRYVAADLFRYLLQDKQIALRSEREQGCLTLLAEDLKRQAAELTIEIGSSTDIPGLGPRVVPMHIIGPRGDRLVVCITHSVTPDFVADPKLEEIKEYSMLPLIAQSELTIRRSLQSATQAVLGAIGLA